MLKHIFKNWFRRKPDYEKYHNLDPHCSYAFSNDPLGYCWSYANFIDGDLMHGGKKITTKEEMKEFCKDCDLYTLGKIPDEDIEPVAKAIYKERLRTKRHGDANQDWFEAIKKILKEKENGKS